MLNRLSPSPNFLSASSPLDRSQTAPAAAPRAATSAADAVADRFEPRSSSTGTLIAGNPAAAASALMMNALVLLTPGQGFSTMTMGDAVSGSVGRRPQSTEFVVKRGLGGV